MARVSLTQKQLKTEEGAELLELLMRQTKDGKVDPEEVEELRLWLASHTESDMNAVAFLAGVVEEIHCDGEVDLQERWDLLMAIERVVPPDQRAIVQMRRRKTGEPATQRQIEFLVPSDNCSWARTTIRSVHVTAG